MTRTRVSYQKDASLARPKASFHAWQLDIVVPGCAKDEWRSCDSCTPYLKRRVACHRTMVSGNPDFCGNANSWERQGERRLSNNGDAPVAACGLCVDRSPHQRRRVEELMYEHQHQEHCTANATASLPKAGWSVRVNQNSSAAWRGETLLAVCKMPHTNTSTFLYWTSRVFRCRRRKYTYTTVFPSCSTCSPLAFPVTRSQAIAPPQP